MVFLLTWTFQQSPGIMRTICYTIQLTLILLEDELIGPAYHPCVCVCVCVCVRVCVCAHAQMDALWDLEPERTVVPAAPSSTTLLQQLQAPCLVAQSAACLSPGPAMCPVGFVAITGFLDSFCGWLGFPFLFIHCLVTRSFKFCLNFVCLSFSLPACSLSVHAVLLTVFAAHSLLPLVSIRCKLRTCGECLPPQAPSPCEYKTVLLLHCVSQPHLLRARGPASSSFTGLLLRQRTTLLWLSTLALLWFETQLRSSLCSIHLSFLWVHSLSFLIRYFRVQSCTGLYEIPYQALISMESKPIRPFHHLWLWPWSSTCYSWFCGWTPDIIDMCGALSVRICKEAPATLDSVDGPLKLLICVELSVYVRASVHFSGLSICSGNKWSMTQSC